MKGKSSRSRVDEGEGGRTKRGIVKEHDKPTVKMFPSMGFYT